MLVVVLVVAIVAAGCTALPEPLTRDQQVDQLIAFVEAKRGHEFRTRPTVTFVPDAEFREHVLEAIESAAPELAIDEVAFKALGWMAPSDDLFESYRVAFGSAVVGFYDPVSKVLEVRGSDLTPYRREVVVHELTHALDDQLFGLDEAKGPGVLDEAQFSYLIAVEGDAAHVQRKYVRSMSPFDQLASIVEQLSFPVDAELLSVPLALLSISQTPYLRGPEFVSRLGGMDAVDAMFERFPVTTEQAWDVAKYLADERPEQVDVPPIGDTASSGSANGGSTNDGAANGGSANGGSTNDGAANGGSTNGGEPNGGTVVASGSWGRFLTSLILTDGVNMDARIKSVTNGWAGDAYVTWTSGDESCIRIDTRQDDADSSARLGAALDKWASRSGASLERLDATTTRLTRCA